jgi:hypothetical protein
LKGIADRLRTGGNGDQNVKIDAVVWKMKKAIEQTEPTNSKTLQFVSVPRKPDPVRTLQFQIVHRVEIVQEQVDQSEVGS